VALADRPNAGVLVDTLHVWRAGDTYDNVAAVDPRLVPYAQSCDALLTPAGTDDASLLIDTLDDRLCPGEGGLDAEPFSGLFVPEYPCPWKFARSI
jgi:sugar phosphate isomerase/epimerase